MVIMRVYLLMDKLALGRLLPWRGVKTCQELYPGQYRHYLSKQRRVAIQFSSNSACLKYTWVISKIFSSLTLLGQQMTYHLAFQFKHIQVEILKLKTW
nr:hypothetical protein Iba_scaffold29901CG0080 [Ipomoea batatas]